MTDSNFVTAVDEFTSLIYNGDFPVPGTKEIIDLLDDDNAIFNRTVYKNCIDLERSVNANVPEDVIIYMMRKFQMKVDHVIYELCLVKGYSRTIDVMVGNYSHIKYIHDKTLQILELKKEIAKYKSVLCDY